MRLRAIGSVVACALAAASVCAFAQPAPSAGKTGPHPAPRQLVVTSQKWTGDFDAMLERRAVRFLVPYSRTLFYVDKGQERGITAELAREFERYLNKKYSKQLGKRPLTVFLIVTTRDRLFPDLAAGLGDVSAGNLTVTDERRKVADFFAPEDRQTVNEIVLTAPGGPSIANVDDLAGKTVHVRRSSSYYDSLVALNARLEAAGKPPANLVLVPEGLEDEDMMEMLNAGLLQTIVVDDWKARIWSKLLPKMAVHQDVAVRQGGRTGWAIRKNSPKLAAELEAFYRTEKKDIDYLTVQHMKRPKTLKDPTQGSEYRQFEQTVELFRKYGGQYRFDPLMLAAQGFQESGLNQNAKSAVGAIGVMQVMPTTGKELGVGDIRVVEPNVHAGAKYLDQLMSKAFPDAQFDEMNRSLFAFASYNCGPGNVRKARDEARKRGLDPDKWFNNVEVVIAERVGMETTTYVRNIYKYYAAYKLVEQAREAADKARRQVAPAK